MRRLNAQPHTATAAEKKKRKTPIGVTHADAAHRNYPTNQLESGQTHPEPIARDHTENRRV